MKLIDVIHYYIGCPCVTEEGKTGIIGNINKGHAEECVQVLITVEYPEKDKDGLNLWDVYNDGEDCTRVTLLLRAINDVTAEELTEFNKLGYNSCHTAQACATRTHWLIKNRFDVFGLIESGQAINIKTFTPKTI